MVIGVGDGITSEYVQCLTHSEDFIHVDSFSTDDFNSIMGTVSGALCPRNFINARQRDDIAAENAPAPGTTVFVLDLSSRWATAVLVLSVVLLALSLCRVVAWPCGSGQRRKRTVVQYDVQEFTGDEADPMNVA